MRLCRFNDCRVGVVDGDEAVDVTDAVTKALPAMHWPVPKGDALIARLPELASVLEKAMQIGRRFPLSSLLLLSPVANPEHVIAAPLNYALHVKEAADPNINYNVHRPEYEGFETPIDKFGLFLKSQSGIIGPGEGVQIHFPNRRNDHEVELAVVIGTEGKAIPQFEAMTFVAGYGIGLDISVRGTEDRSYRKSADSYTVLGPWLVTADEIPDPGALDLSISVDGEERQKSNTRQLIVDIAELIERASRVYRLYPGDVILTGTPQGVGPIRAGNHMHASIQSIGSMDVLVR